jgi:prepilin-type N-terminal cleavage/methylation domain-containing protein
MKDRGFTIIELIVVIIIAGILVAIAMPAFRNLFAKSRLEEARNQVIGFYQGAHRYATTTGVDYVLQVDETNGRFRCLADTTSAVARDSLVLCSGLDLSHGAAGSLSFILQPDGFVRYTDTLTRFSITDEKTGNLLEFYISPLGTVEVEKK